MFNRINKILGITSIVLGFITYASLFIKGIIEVPHMLHLLFFIGVFNVTYIGFNIFNICLTFK